jgi:Ca2+-binding RTX toxin-like protein
LSDFIALSGGNDSADGYSGNDRIEGGPGSDSLDGGDGIDTAIFEKARSAYKTEKLVQDNTTLWKVTDLATGDVDELRNIEKLEFAKATVPGYQNLVQTEVTLDVAGTPAVAYRLYKAAFARDPDLGGLGYWISALEQYLNPNLSPEQNPYLLDVAKTFVESPEFKEKYGADVDNATYIRNLYKNALGRDPLIPDPVTGKTDAGYTYWVGVLDAKAASRSDLFVYFSESTENKAAIEPIIATGVEYVPWVPPGG